MGYISVDVKEILKGKTIDKVMRMEKQTTDLEDCIYHDLVNRKGLIKDRSEVQLPDEVDSQKGLNECYDCDGHKQSCPDYKRIKDLTEDYQQAGEQERQKE